MGHFCYCTFKLSVCKMPVNALKIVKNEQGKSWFAWYALFHASRSSCRCVTSTAHQWIQLESPLWFLLSFVIIQSLEGLRINLQSLALRKLRNWSDNMLHNTRSTAQISQQLLIQLDSLADAQQTEREREKRTNQRQGWKEKENVIRRWNL